MKTGFLKPSAGLLVRDPVTGLHLAADGEEKVLTPYWLRRMADGDVVEASLDATPVPSKSKKEA